MTQPTPHVRILRHQFPVDGNRHTLTLPGPILAWGCRHAYTIDLWTWSGRPGDITETRTFSVHGTGEDITHPADGHLTHRATVTAPVVLVGAVVNALVWHILEHDASDAIPLPVDLR